MTRPRLKTSAPPRIHDDIVMALADKLMNSKHTIFAFQAWLIWSLVFVTLYTKQKGDIEWNVSIQGG